MSDERMTMPLEQLPEKIEVSLMLSREDWKALWEEAVNQQPQISVVEVIHKIIREHLWA